MARVTPDLLDPARYPHRVEITTRFADLDPNRHINNVAIAAMMEDARLRFFGGTRAHDRLGSLQVMIVALRIEYLAQAHHPAPFVIHSGVFEIGRSSWQVAQVAIQHDEPRAFCRSTMVTTDGARAVPLPEALRRALSGHALRPVERTTA